jgi:hypothetical protein
VVRAGGLILLSASVLMSLSVQMVLGMVYSGTMEADHMAGAPLSVGDLVFLKWWEGSRSDLGLVIGLCPPGGREYGSSDWMAEVSFPSARSRPRWIPVNVLGRCEESAHGG